MKKIFLLLAFSVFAFAKAQVSTSSATPVATDAVTIIFNAVGTPLENSTQNIHLYAGVTINNQPFQRANDTFFSNDPSINPIFTRTSSNNYQITLGPSLNEFFNVDPNVETITAIDFVIRNATGSNGANPIQTRDFSLPIFPPGLNAVISSPSDNQIFAINQTIDIIGNSSQSASLELFVNDSSIATTSGTMLTSPFTFNSPGNFTIRFTSNTGNATAQDDVSAFVPASVENVPRPSGLQNGVNENTDGSVTFLLAAPRKSSALLIADFTDWKPTLATQMKKDGDYFWVTVPANQFTAGVTFQYQYIVDNTIKIADPFSTLILDPQNDQFIKAGNFPDLPPYPVNETTGDITLHTYQEAPYNWTVTDFQRPDQENLVIYELLVRDFSEQDSFQAIIDNIDYIVNLGVNAVEFMPLNEFEGTDSWGYNPKFHGALDKAYGTPDKFKELVDLLHANGIAVIIDVVYNHAFGQSPLVQMWPDASGFNAGPDNPYLNQTARHPFNVGTDFNHESLWTQQYVKQTMQYFLDEFQIDGFRFDLSKGFTQRNSGSNVGLWNRRDDSRIAILNDYQAFLFDNNDNDLYLILEHLSDNDEEKILADAGFMLWGKMTDQYKQNALGFASNSDVFRTYFSSRSFNDQHLVAYSESHDEQRIVYETVQNGNQSNSSHRVRNLSVALDRQEAIAAILYSIPGPKMLWQFGELGYDIMINQNGRTGRKPVPFSNGYSTDSDRTDLYEVTSELIKLKIKYPETFNTTDNFLDLSNGLVKRVRLNGADFDVIVVANFDVTSKNIAPQYTQTGTWYDFFEGTSQNISNQNSTVNVPAGGFKLLSTQVLNTTASTDSESLELESIQLSPNPSNSFFQLSKDVENLKIYDLTGKLVKEFKGTREHYDISNMSTGLYIIEAYDDQNNRSSIKLIKK